jgi:hypothetical protein
MGAWALGGGGDRAFSGDVPFADMGGEVLILSSRVSDISVDCMMLTGAGIGISKSMYKKRNDTIVDLTEHALRECSGTGWRWITRGGRCLPSRLCYAMLDCQHVLYCF